MEDKGFEVLLDRDSFLDALSGLRGMVEKGSSLPVLRGVYLRAGKGRIEMSVTDLEIFSLFSCAADVRTTGTALLDFWRLFAFVHELKSDSIHLKKQDGEIIVSGGDSVFKFQGMDTDDFPTMAETNGIVMVDIDNAVLGEMINKTIHSITMEEAGFKLSGVFMERIDKDGEDFLRMVATDGHRLSLVDKRISGIEKMEMDSGVIILKKEAMELLRLANSGGKKKKKGFFQEYDTGFSLGIKGNNLVAKKGKALIVIRLLDAKFPDYQNVIPERGEDKENIITINKKSLLEAMKRMMIIRSDQYQGVKMNIGINYLEMVSVNPDLGNAEEKVEVKYEGKPIEMGFNPRYFIDALQPMDSDIVYLDIKDQTSPCLITGDQDDGFLGLIMPMRV